MQLRKFYSEVRFPAPATRSEARKRVIRYGPPFAMSQPENFALFNLGTKWIHQIQI